MSGFRGLVWLSYGQDSADRRGVHSASLFMKPVRWGLGKPGHNPTGTLPPRGWSPMRFLLSVAAALAVALPAGRADSKDPLRFFPEQTDIVLKVEKPRALLDAIVKHDLAKEAQELQI